MVFLAIQPAGELLKKETPAQLATNGSPTLIDTIINVGIIALIILAVVVVIIFILKWFFDRRSMRKDVYTSEFLRTVDSCKMNKSERYLKSVLGLPKSLISKGVPIYVKYPTLYYDENKKSQEVPSNEKQKKIKGFEPYLMLSEGGIERIGSYVGHCPSMDGTMNLLIASSKNKVLGIFPKKMIIKVRLKSVQTVSTTKIKDGETEEEITEIENPRDLFTMSHDMIMIHAIGLVKHGEYYYPVTKRNDGYVADARPNIYQDMWKIPMESQVLSFGRATSKVTEEAIKSNPTVQWFRKTGTDLTAD